MKRSSLTALAAAALTAVVTLGLPASTASAASGDKNRQPGPGAVTQADRRLATEQRAVARLVSSTDAALGRATRTVTRAVLPVGEAEVLANIAGDRVALADLGTAAAAATTAADVRAIGTQVRTVRPEVYGVVVNGLRQSVRVQERVAANRVTLAGLATQADAKELEAYDVTAVRDLLASAGVANDEALVLAAAAIEKGLVLTAFGTHDETSAFAADVAAAGDLLDVVDAQLLAAADSLTAMVPVVVEAPVTEEPVV